MTRLVLASGSAFRKQLLSRLGIDFVVSAQDIDESRLESEQPVQMVKRLARSKAQSGLVNAGCDGSLSSSDDLVVIGSDQIGVLGSKILGKPGSFELAVEQLEFSSGKTVEFLTAVCLLRSDSDESLEFIHTTQVRFRELSPDEIKSYVSREQPYASCGSFQVEGLGISLVEEIISTDPTALIGLPLIRLHAALKQWRVIN